MYEDSEREHCIVSLYERDVTKVTMFSQVVFDLGFRLLVSVRIERELFPRSFHEIGFI